MLLSDCRLDNKKELIKLLDLKSSFTSDDEIILKSYLKFGEKCLNYLLGDFAFAIWDKIKNKLFCARDHFGVKPFFYYFNGNSLCFASEIKSILTQSDLDFNIDESYIADHLSIIKSEKERTNFCEIKKLSPGSTMNYSFGAIEIKKYWELEPQKIIKNSEEEIISGFKSLLIESVKSRLNTDLKTGAELSGGIDSSSIVSIASKNAEIETFSHILPESVKGKLFPFKDEKNYIDNIIRFCKIKNTNYITSEKSGLIEALEKNISDFGYLSQQNYSTFSDQLYNKAANQNINILLSGFGGDEMVTATGIGYLNELANSRSWKKLKFELKKRNQKQFKLLKYIFKIYFPLVYNTLKNKNNSWWLEKFKYLALNNEFADALHLKTKFKSQINQDNPISLQQKNITRITHTYVSHRLEYCAISARKYGIEYRYPFLDKRLIEFYLSIPSHLKAKDGIKRFPIRIAMENLLPKEIQWRNDKTGATIPTVFMRFYKDKDQIKEIINRAETNEIVKRYIDVQAYKEWFTRNSKGNSLVNPGAFYNYLKLILFIEQNPTLF